MTKPDILVRDHMKPVTHTFKTTTSVEQVVKTLMKNHLVGAPVVDDDGHLIGFITEKDCIKEILNDSYYSQDHQVAADIMRKNPLSVSPTTDILALAEEMMGKRPKMYPVVEDGEIIGIITRADVLKALSKARISSANKPK